MKGICTSQKSVGVLSFGSGIALNLYLNANRIPIDLLNFARIIVRTLGGGLYTVDY